jgi:hypothetical protein
MTQTGRDSCPSGRVRQVPAHDPEPYIRQFRGQQARLAEFEVSRREDVHGPVLAVVGLLSHLVVEE